MKTKEELNALKEEVESVNEKLQELTEEELKQVTGGSSGIYVSPHGRDLDLPIYEVRVKKDLRL